MNKHPDTEECLRFSFSIMSKFKDCLSRQVAEAITINYTADQILNSKNEYMANCLTRICVEEERFDKQKREQEMAEEAEKQTPSNKNIRDQKEPERKPRNPLMNQQKRD
jgi:hypothetical protein